MAKVTLKIPRKLHHVEILSSEKLKTAKIKPFIVTHTFQDFDEDNTEKPVELFFRERDFEEELSPEQEPLPQEEPEVQEPQYIQFMEYRTVCRDEKPQKISLDRVQLEEMLPISEVREEVQHAYDRGFDDAQQLTTNTFENQILKLQERVSNFDYVILELRDQFNKELDKVARSIASTSIMVASHILNREVSTDSMIVVEQARKAVSSLDKDLVFRINVHPNNVKLLEEVRITLDYDKSKVENIQIVPDESVDEGGCVLYTSAGTIDSRISTQLESLDKALNQLSLNLSEKEEGMKEDVLPEDEDMMP